MTDTHSTIETTRPGDLVRRFECPGCRFVLDQWFNGGGRIVCDGDRGVEHTGSGWRVYAYR